MYMSQGHIGVHAYSVTTSNVYTLAFFYDTPVENLCNNHGVEMHISGMGDLRFEPKFRFFFRFLGT